MQRSHLLASSSGTSCSTRPARLAARCCTAKQSAVGDPVRIAGVTRPMSRAMEVSSRASDSAGPSRTPSWVTGSRQQRRGGITRAASSSDVDVASTKGKILTLPTVLTILRVLAIPAVVACWFATAPGAKAACTALFVGASITDFLDGYLARKMNASTPFGAFLDPVADKLMVAAVLVLLSTTPIASGPLAGNQWFITSAGLIIISREITVSALREWAASLGGDSHGAVAVNWIGKWKTATQMASLTLLLLLRQETGGVLEQVSGILGPALLLVAAGLTVWSMVVYFAAVWKYM